MNNSAFIFDDVRVSPDRQIGMHSHNQWELSHIIHGRGIRTVGDKTESFREGEVILIPPAIPHIWKFDSTTTDSDGCIANLTLLFENRILDGLATLLPEFKDTINKIRSLRDALSYSGKALNDITSTLYAMRAKSAGERIPYIMKLLTILTESGDTREAGYHNAQNRIEQRLEKIRTFCACNYAHTITLTEIASYAGMNKSAFCTFLRRHTGKTLSEYVNDLRLQRAVERIKCSDENISDIAYSVGFANVTYFNRLFRVRYGTTPLSMRNHGDGYTDKHEIYLQDGF